MDFLTRITEAVNYIENNLDGEINEAVLSKITCCSMHQFGRVFSYVCDMSLAEYIRRRRMTLAAVDLQNGEKVIDTALKYGYNSPDSFARAFIAIHGVTPREASKGEAVNHYPRISFHITIKGDVRMNYRIVEKEAFKIVGMKMGLDFSKDSEKTIEARRSRTQFKLLIKMTDEETPDNMKKIFKPDDGGAKKIDVYAGVGHLFREPLWRVGITQTLDNGVLWIAVGAEADDNSDYDKSHTWHVPGGMWAVFTVKGKLRSNTDESGQYDVLSEVYSSLINRHTYKKDSELLQPIDKTFARAEVEWMDQSGYERAGNYEMTVYPLGDTESDDYCCEAWIPVRKK